jgi:hypothetical protein
MASRRDCESRSFCGVISDLVLKRAGFRSDLSSGIMDELERLEVNMPSFRVWLVLQCVTADAPGKIR